MIEKLTDAELDKLLAAADPLPPGARPTAAETEATLHRLLATGPGAARPDPAVHRRRSRYRLVAATTAGVAALAVALTLVLGTTAESPAYAVTRNSDGTVTVTLLRVSGIAGANQRLASMGVRVRIVNAVSLAAHVARLRPCQGAPAGPVRTLTLNPASIPRKQLLLLGADRAAHLRYWAPAAGAPATKLPTPSLTLSHSAKLNLRVMRPSGKALRAAQALVRRARTQPLVRRLGARLLTLGARHVEVYCGRALMSAVRAK